MLPERDLVLAGAPDNAGVREGDNMWILDDAGRFTFPRIGVEAIGSQWLDRGMQANVGFADGRALKIEPSGGDVSVVLETEPHGEIRIDGRTDGSTYSVQGGALFLDWTVANARLKNAVTFHQGGALYTWDGEQAYGMVERSLPEEQITR
jgi:prepilin-type processing-associated H-X9-DG protein